MENSKFDENLQVVIHGSGGRTTAGEVKIQTWTSQQRVVRSVKLCIACWGGAIVALFIPLLHFILVPVLLLLGPFLAWRVYGQKAQIIQGQGICPFCEQTMKIEPSLPQFPLEDLCQHCRGSVSIDRKSS